MNSLQKPSINLPVKINSLFFFRWVAILYQFISYYIQPGNKTLYETVSCTVNLFQNAAILEVIHAATGMVRTSAVMTAFQVGEIKYPSYIHHQ